MMKRLLFFLILILGVNAAAAESIITVDINQSGDAVWTMEKFIPLTKSGLNEWEIAIKTGQNMSSYRNIADYENIIALFQNSTMNFTNRSMVVEPFNITYDTRKTLSDGLGIIRYTFIWKNFSYSDSKNIYVGDAIPGGVLLLSPDNQLIIKLPEGYNVTNSSPAFDKRNGNSLIWDGTLYNNFSNGEPFLILSRVNTTNATTIKTVTNVKTTNTTWIIAGIVIVLFVIIVSVAFIRFWKKKRSENISTKKLEFYEDMVTQVPKEMIHEISEIPEVWTKIVQSVQREFGQESIEELEKAAREQRLKNMGLDPNIPLSDLAKEDIEDEEMIKQFILRSGGQAYQSDIVEHSGLSKSKISMVLSKMKDDGMIIKIRKGKENLIRLVNMSADNKGP